VFYVGLRKMSGRKLIQHGEASLLHGCKRQSAWAAVNIAVALALAFGQKAAQLSCSPRAERHAAALTRP